MKIQRIKKFIFRRYYTRRYKIEMYSYNANANANTNILYSIEFKDEVDPETLLYIFEDSDECLKHWRSLIKLVEESKV